MVIAVRTPKLDSRVAQGLGSQPNGAALPRYFHSGCREKHVAPWRETIQPDGVELENRRSKQAAFDMSAESEHLPDREKPKSWYPCR